MYKVFCSKQGKRYLYDSFSNHFFEMDAESYERLPADEGKTEELRCFGDEFWASVYGDKKDSALKQFPIETTLEEEPEILVLELTQQCNFRCGYCIYSGHYKYERVHNNKRMSRQMADRIIQRYFGTDKSPGYVSFYGGEPLLQFPLIQYIVEEIEARDRQPEYAMTTNGSLLLKDEIVRYLVRKKFRLTVSFDGINQDRYRRTRQNEPTMSNVIEALQRLKVIDENYFNEYVSLSITLAPPYDLLENARYFNSHPLLSGVKLLVNTINENDSDFFENGRFEAERKKLSEDYKVLAEEFIENDRKTLPFHTALFGDAMLRIQDRFMGLQQEEFPPGPCIPGKNRLFITATGEKYMCERVGTYGQLGTVADNRKPLDNYHQVLMDFRDNVVPRCKGCLYVRICDACFSVFRRGRKFSDAKQIRGICEEKCRWFDFMMYVFLSKKERELKE